MLRLVVVRRAILLALFVFVIRAQTAPVVFDVASIRPTPPGGTGLTAVSPYGTGRFTATNITLENLIALAFGVSDSQIVGAPGWLASDYFDLNVKAQDGVRLTYENLKAPLQALLMQRFRLAVRRGQKDVQGYALVIAKGGPKLKSAAKVQSQGNILPDGIRAPGTTMATFAGVLARVVARPVVDETGLAGLYNVTLKYAPANSTASELPSIFTALQEQAGLKLEPRKTQVETLIIDQVERVPAEN